MQESELIEIILLICYLNYLGPVSFSSGRCWSLSTESLQTRKSVGWRVKGGAE